MQRPPLWPLDLSLFAYMAVGLAGALLISDDFDAVRFLLLGWLGVPLAVVYFGSRMLYPSWPRQLPKVAALSTVVLLVLFATGIVPLINAATASDQIYKRTVDHGRGLAVRDVKRGGLGWTYQTRTR